MPSPIRLATPADAPVLQAIYAPIVADTPISFEWEPPSVEEMARRVEKTFSTGLPWLVYERDGEVLGYVYASKHRERAAYQWCVDVSVYVDPRAHRMGIGRRLYTSLFALLTLQGYRNAYAGATLPNAGSVGLHESLGFRRVGVYERVGYKLNAWHDVIWWVLPLAGHADDPHPPLPLAEAARLPGWADAMAAGLRESAEVSRGSA